MIILPARKVLGGLNSSKCNVTSIRKLLEDDGWKTYPNIYPYVGDTFKGLLL